MSIKLTINHQVISDTVFRRNPVPEDLPDQPWDKDDHYCVEYKTGRDCRRDDPNCDCADGRKTHK